MRFRLLSYVCAMLLLAGVVGANLTPIATRFSFPVSHNVESCRAGNATPIGYRTYANRDGSKLYSMDLLATDKCYCYGWPRTALKLYPRVGFWGEREPSLVWQWPTLALNIAIGLAIPIAGLLACEFVLRRYAPRRMVE